MNARQYIVRNPAIKLNGNTQQISLSGSSALNLNSQSHTIEYWIYRETSGSNKDCVFSTKDLDSQPTNSAPHTSFTSMGFAEYDLVSNNITSTLISMENQWWVVNNEYNNLV